MFEHYTNMNISTINFINKIPTTYTNKINFHGIKNYTDSFEYQNPRTKTEIRNPYNNKSGYFITDFDLSKKQTIELKTHNSKNSVLLDYDPNRTETIYDMKKRENIEVVVLKSENKNNNDEFACHILSKDLKTEYGQILYSKWDTEDYEGIEEVFVKSNCEHIEGLNKIADKYAVQYCKENDIVDNITCYPKPEEYRNCYNEGKRFIIPQKNSNQYNFMIKNYHNSDPNEIIKNPRIDTSKWGSMKMYLPDEKVNEYYRSYITDTIELYNPMGDYTCYTNEPIDLSRPYKIKCISKPSTISDITLDFNPKRTGQIYDKENQKPIDIFILKLHDKRYPKRDAFIFVSKDLKHEYGYVQFDKGYKTGDYDYDMIENYKDEGILGERIIVSYLQNNDDKKYGGIGKLADKVAVGYCIDNNIQTNIVSRAGEDSYIAHYSRGKRFFKPEKDSDEYDFLMNTYGTPNPNKALKELWNEHRRTGAKIDLTEWNKHFFTMFLPKHKVEQFKQELNTTDRAKYSD